MPRLDPGIFIIHDTLLSDVFFYDFPAFADEV